MYTQNGQKWTPDNNLEFLKGLKRETLIISRIYAKKNTQKRISEWFIFVLPQGCTQQAADFPATNIHSPGVHWDFLPPGEVLTLGSVPGLGCCGFCRRVRIHSITHLSQASIDKTMAPRIMYYSLLCRSGQHHLKHTKFVGNIIRFDSAPGLQSYLGN